MSYHTRSGRESRVPGRFGATTSQGVGEGGAPSQNTATDENPSQERQGGASPIRNTETSRRYSPPWTDETTRSFMEGIRASRYRREEDARRGSGAVPTSQTPGEPALEWTKDDGTLFLEGLRRARARRMAGTGGESEPTGGVGHADGTGDSDRSIKIVEDKLDMSARDAESTPNVQSQASNSRGSETSTGRKEAEGVSRNSGRRTKSDSPEVVTASGRPAPVPQWILEEVRRNQQARDREESILSQIPEGPVPSINVGGTPEEFRILSLKVDDKGSPQYRYGIATPDQTSLHTVYVRGTPESNNGPLRAGQVKGGTIPKPRPAGGLARTTGSRNPTIPEKTMGTGWRAGLKPVETLVRSMVDSMTGGRAQTSLGLKEDVAPPPPPKDKKASKAYRSQSEDDFGMTTDTERFLRDYKTPPRELVDLPPGKSPKQDSRFSDTSSSEVDMADRIPTNKKGKGRARFATPIVQPTPMLQDARKAEIERRRRLQAELEEKMRRQEQEWYETQHQLAVLASEQTAIEEAEKLEQAVLRDESDQATSDQGMSTQEKSDVGTMSASENSGKENSTKETDVPTTTDTESERAPPPDLRKNKSSATAMKTTKVEKALRGKEGKDSERKTKEKKDEPVEHGEPQDIAMRTAQLVFEMQKDAIKTLVMEQMEGMREQFQPAQRTYSPLSWRTSGFQRGKSLTPSMLGNATTKSRGNSTKRSAMLAESSESSEKDTSEEEPKPKKRRKESVEEREKMERKAAMKALKVGQPDPWSGKAVYDKFDRWVDQVDEWQRNHGLSEYAVIATMGFLLTGSAKDWFKDYVRDKEREWTLEELNSALFQEMFPPDIDSTLREAFDSAEQGTSSLKEWHKFITKLASRVPNLSEHDVRRRFMMGANAWLREKWAEGGFGPEDPTITMRMLVESGQRFERARAIYTGEKQKMLSMSKGPTSGGTWNKDQKTHKNDGTKPQEKGGGGYQTRGQNAETRQDPSEPSGGRMNPRKELTEEEMAELRAEDRCFECTQMGHTARNCPKRREISPTHKGKGKKTTIYNASLRFEAMKTKPGGPTIRLNMIEPLAENGVIASERRWKEEAIRAHQLQESRESVGLIGRILHTYLERQLGEVRPEYEWQKYSPLRFTRFKIASESEGVFSVHDTWDGWRTHLQAKKIFDPSFKVNQWVKEMKKDAPLISDLNEPGATVPNEELSSETDESPEESGVENNKDSDESYEEISLESGRRSSEESNGRNSSKSSDNDLPELGDVSDLSSEDDDDLTSEDDSESEESTSKTETTGGDGPGSESEEAKLWQELRRVRSRFRSSVAPEAYLDLDGSSDSGEENPPSANSQHPIRCAVAQTTTKPRGKSKARDSKSKKELWESREDNSASAKDDDRVMPHPIILTVYVNGRACRALLDSGAFSDFISTTLVDNLGLKKQPLSQAMTLQMAVQGSRSKINARTTVDFAYSTIKCPKAFDIINIANYDMILGTPFFWQHKILAGMNPTRIAIGADDPLPITGEDFHTSLGAMSIDREDSLQDVRIYSNNAKGTEQAISDVEASECPSRPNIVGDHIEAERLMLMDAALRQTPGRGQGKRNHMQESTVYSEDSQDSERSASEDRAPRGGGKSQSSVLREPINPQDSPRVVRTSVAPVASKPAGTAAPAQYLAKSTKRSMIETDEDGESEMGSSREYKQKKTCEKKEYKAMVANRKAKKAPISQPQISFDDSKNDQETVKGSPKRGEESNEVEIRRLKAEEELIHANADLKEGDDEESLNSTLIPTKFLSLIPIPPLISSLSTKQQNNRHFDSRNVTTKPEPALRTRMGTPFSEPKPAGLGPLFGHYRRTPFDSIDVARTVSATSTTPALARNIQANVTVEIPPKTPKAPKPPKAAEPLSIPRARLQDEQLLKNNNSITSLAMLFKDLLATNSINNGQAPPSIDAMNETPPSRPKIQPALLPSVPATIKQPQFKLDALLPQDIIMRNAIKGQETGETAQETSEDSLGVDFEQITENEDALFSSEA